MITEYNASRIPQWCQGVTHVQSTSRLASAYFDAVAYAKSWQRECKSRMKLFIGVSYRPMPMMNRTDSERSDRGVPIHKNDRDNNHRDG